MTRGSSDRRERKPKGPRPVTESYLQRAALHYIGRYGTSSENLRRVLARKAARRLEERNLPPDTAEMIESVVAWTLSSGAVDDAAYARSKAGSLLRKGASEKSVRAKLSSKGIGRDAIEASLPVDGIDPLAQARRHAERKRLGPYAKAPDPARRQKDMAAMTRAGFPYAIARTVIDGQGEG